MGTIFVFRREAWITALLLLASATQPATPGNQRNAVISTARYSIDIDLDVAGTCGPQKLATFSRLKLRAVFEPVRFTLPAGLHMPCALEGGNSVNGRGTITTFQICPEWFDDRTPVPAKVNGAPQPFSPVLECVSLDEVMEESPDDSLVTAIGPTIWLRLSPNFSVSGKELSWQFEGIGSGQIGGYEFMFGVPRDNLVKGLPYELQLPVSYGDIGEAGTAIIWLIRLSGK